MTNIIISDTFYPDYNSASKQLLILANHLSKKDLMILTARKINKKINDLNIISVSSPKSSFLFLRFIKELILPFRLYLKYIFSKKKKLIKFMFTVHPFLLQY